jgi:hypothetical protein
MGAEINISAKRSARMRAKAPVNGTTSSSSTPRCSISAAFSPGRVRTGGRSSGRSTATGFGSKVTTMAGSPRSFASSIARPMMAWCPTCTPSKVPMATTRRGPPRGRSPRDW